MNAILPTMTFTMKIFPCKDSLQGTESSTQRHHCKEIFPCMEKSVSTRNITCILNTNNTMYHPKCIIVIQIQSILQLHNYVKQLTIEKSK